MKRKYNRVTLSAKRFAWLCQYARRVPTRLFNGDVFVVLEGTRYDLEQGQ